MKRAVLAALALATVLCMSQNADAQQLHATFDTAIGDAPVPGATASLTLNADGTISATVTSLSTWQLIGFGLDSSQVYDSHDFSSPADVFSTSFATSFGDFWTGWAAGQAHGITSMTWLIGSPGTFTSVLDVIDGTHSPYDGFAYVLNLEPFGVTQYAANFTRVAEVPEPETYALVMAGLGAVALVNRRRAKVRVRAVRATPPDRVR